jgi:hypothetical protein
MSQIIPIYIPTFISDQNYNPSRVLPHIYFYNGRIDCETYWLADVNVGSITRTQFPYFDNYNVVDGEFPTTGSRSLLFNNEEPVYGTAPTASLYSKYWETYVELLYNPVTRLINASAIIPFADYTKLQLNDVIEWRGNYYHLRAINEYSVKTGECTVQLLGPIISNTFTSDEFDPEPPARPADVRINLNEFSSGGVFLDANLIVSGTAYYSSGNFTQSISGGAVANVTLQAAEDTIYNIWNGYSTASATLTIYDDGDLITSSVNTYYSGSGSQYYTIPVTFTAGHTITISGSTTVLGNPGPATSATLDWSFTETDASATMDLYINGNNVESRNATSNGSITVYEDDEIYVDIIVAGCSVPDNIANAYTFDIITEAACASGSTNLTTSTYTVQASDLGTTLSLRTYGSCDGACI